MSEKRNKTLDYLSEAEKIELEPIPGGYNIALYMMFAMLLVALLWAYFAEIDRVVSAKAKIISEEPNVILQLQESTQVRELRVSVGETVRQGQELMNFDPTVFQADEERTKQKHDSYKIQLRGLLEEEQLIQRVDRGQKVTLDPSKQFKYIDNYRKLRSGLTLAEAEVRSLQRRLQTATDMEEVNRQLYEKKFLPKKSMFDTEDKRLEIEQQSLTAQNRVFTMSREINTLKSSLRDEITNTRRELSGLEQELIKAKKRSEQISLVSPIDGIVFEVAKVSAGSIAKAAEPLVSIVPIGAALIVEAQIPGAEISDVKVGQEVKLKFDAYPFQRYGYLIGVVAAISPDSISLQANTNTNESLQRVYLSRITVKEWVFNGSNKKELVIPGMTLSADISVGKRSVMTYLLDPILRVSDEALSER